MKVSGELVWGKGQDLSCVLAATGIDSEGFFEGWSVLKALEGL